MTDKPTVQSKFARDVHLLKIFTKDFSRRSCIATKNSRLPHFVSNGRTDGRTDSKLYFYLSTKLVDLTTSLLTPLILTFFHYFQHLWEGGIRLNLWGTFLNFFPFFQHLWEEGLSVILLQMPLLQNFKFYTPPLPG